MWMKPFFAYFLNASGSSGLGLILGWTLLRWGCGQFLGRKVKYSPSFYDPGDIKHLVLQFHLTTPTLRDLQASFFSRLYSSNFSRKRLMSFFCR